MVIKREGTSCLLQTKKQNQLRNLKRQFLKNTEKDFKIRSCTKSPVARVLFFIIQCIMYNVLNMLKSVVEITAYELKSSINEDINKAVRYGLKSLNLIPVKVLLDCLRWFNEERNRVLRNRLTII